MAWSPLQELVTLDQAKQHLKLSLDIDTEDDDLQLKLLVAHELVMDYLTQRISESSTWADTVQAWTADTAPKRVLAAILYQFAELYRNRGDDTPGRPETEAGSLCPAVVTMLYRLRDPALS